MMDPREAEKSRAAGGEAIDLLPPLPTTGLEGFTFDPLGQPTPDSSALKTTTKTASDKTTDTPVKSTTTPTTASTTTTTIATTNNEVEKTPLDLDFLKAPQESSFLNDILGDIPIGLVSQITDTSAITTKGTPAVEPKPKKEDPPSKDSVSAKASSSPIAVDNDVNYLAAVIDEGTKLPDFSAESFSLLDDVVRAGESSLVDAADKTQKKSNKSTLGVDELGANVGNASTTEKLVPTTSTSAPTTASSELPTIPLATKVAAATVVETKDEKNELLDSHKDSDVNPGLEVVKDDTPVLKLEDPAEASTTSPAFVGPTEKKDNAEEGLAKSVDELISTGIPPVDGDVTPDTLQLDLKVDIEPQAIERNIIAEAAVEDVPESFVEKASLSSTIKEPVEKVDDDDDKTKTSITNPDEAEKSNSDALKITTVDLENKKETGVTPVAKESEATAAVIEAPEEEEEDQSVLLLPTQSTPELGSVETLETLDRAVADSQQAQSLPATVSDKAVNDTDETMEVSENSLFSVSPTSENATSVDESFDSRGSSFDELPDSKPTTTEIMSELEQVSLPTAKSEKAARSRSKKTRKTSGSKSSSKHADSATDSPPGEIKLLDPQPEVFVYTSYASGTLHVVPQTRRIQQILDTNQIKHTIVELSTDPKAKRNWKWKGNGKNIPCVVRNNEILADLKTLEALNEKNLVYQKIVVEEIY
ncbi:hypothetical protein D0Z00_000539 [Geotrichum galactomycetum]|uniref:Uncharacterized protein n=1 Tax=Geotrichum galactomycetum TaxID=27317 RepID=A0ACB6V9P3_9ASCO|nr:hypothetical protein D0Z00_000539 [Geotrichum candidum]